MRFTDDVRIFPTLKVLHSSKNTIPLKFYADLPLIRTQNYSFSHTHTVVPKYISSILC